MADGWAIATQFAGADLGAKINAALAAGYQCVEVPPNSSLVISTTVQLTHGCTIRFANRYPNHIVCATNDKPVFEAIGGIRHFRIQGGIFDGSATNTPLCLLLIGRTTGASGQCGDTTCLDNVQASGNWGMGCVVNIGSEIDMFTNCHLWIQGDGDSLYSGTRASVVIANMDFFGFSLTAGQPGAAYTAVSTSPGSTSAHIFQNCDIRSDANSSCVLLKGQVEDTTIVGAYINATGDCGIKTEPGDIGGGTWTCPRRLYITGGRYEVNGGPSAGLPMLLVKSLNQASMGIYNVGINNFGMFVGSTGTTTPAIQTNGTNALIYALEVGLNHHLEYSSVLLDHQTADLNFAKIESRFNAAINCTGRTIANSFIRTAGLVSGTLGTKTVAVHSGGSDWTM